MISHGLGELMGPANKMAKQGLSAYSYTLQ